MTVELSDEDREVLLELDRRSRSGIEAWSPQAPTPKQQEFLDAPELEAVFGGAAGGGKSSCLLMGALQYANTPGYAGLILRKTFADLALPGAIMDRSHQWLANTTAHWDGTNKTWRFPSGASLTFGYLEIEKQKFRYQSSEFQYIAFDELTQFGVSLYTYMFSRLRRSGELKVPLRMRSGTNPGGVGHQWVYERLIDAKTRVSDSRFVPSLLSDNPHIDAEEYRRSLAKLDDVTRKQLEEGLWIQDKSGLVYKYTSENLVERLPDRDDWIKVATIDFGSSARVPSTAFAVWYSSIADPAAYLVSTSKHADLTVSGIVEHYRALEMLHGAFSKVGGDQGALGLGYINEMRRRHAIPITGVEKKNKLGYRKLFNGELRDKRILIVADGNSDWLEEANNLMWDEDGLDVVEGQPDHATDAGLYGWRETRSFLFKPTDAPPPRGTPEAAQLEVQKYQQRLAQQVVNRGKGEWWET